MLRFYEAGYRSAANPLIETKHFFPDFKNMIRDYIFRIYGTIKLIDGKSTPFTHISFEKAILAPSFAFATLISLIFSGLYDFSAFSILTCGIIFLVLSSDFIFEGFQRKGLKTLPLLGIHWIVCNVIFLSGTICKILVKVNKIKGL